MIYVEPESAYDVLRSKIVLNDKLVVCEPRMIGGKTFAPLVPQDVEMPARIQTVPGVGRGVPFSVVADQLPIVSGTDSEVQPLELDASFRNTVTLICLCIV